MRLGDIVKIKTGKLNANAASPDGKYPFFTCAKEIARISTYSYDCECVLVAGNGDLNVKYYKGKFDAYQRTYIIEDNSNGKLLMPYLYFFLDKYVETLREKSIGGVIKYIKLENLTEANIPLPSIDKQQDIVNCLSIVNNIKSKCNQELSKLDELVKSRFIEMFGDPVTNPHGYPIYSLSDISSSRLGKMLDRKKQTGENSYPYLANYNVQWFRFELENLHKMDFDEADRKEFELKKGDLLVCEGGEVGRCAIWNNEMEGCYFQKALHRVRCNPQYIIPEYLGYTFFWHSQYNGFSDAISGVSTIAHLPGDRLKKLKIIVPPLDLQYSFAEFLQLADKSKLVARALLAKCKLLQEKLMQDYFC